MISLSNTYSTAQAASNQAFTRSATSTSLPKSFRNMIINGSLAIDQRNQGAPITITSNNSAPITADRFPTTFTASTTPYYTVQRLPNSNNDLPPVPFSLRLTCNSNTTLNGSSVISLRHPIEGTFMKQLFWGTSNALSATLSGYIRTNQTGTHALAIQDSAATRSYIMHVTLCNADTWQQFQYTIPGPSNGTFGTDSNLGATLFIAAEAPGKSNPTTSTWLAGDYICPSTFTTLTAGKYIEVSSLQLEKGSNATAFEYRAPALEWQLCQRYYETSFPYGMAPSNMTTSAAPGNSMYLQGQFGASYIYFEQPKRSIPTMTFYNPWNSNGNVFVPDTNTTSANLAALNQSVGGFSVRSTDAALQNQMNVFNWAANSEL